MRALLDTSDMRSHRFTLPATMLLLAAALAPGAAAQVRCDSNCVESGGVRTAAPTGGAATAGPPETAAEVIDLMLQQYEERVADVNNYLVVQTTFFRRGEADSTTSQAALVATASAIHAPPAVLYNEKKVVDGKPKFTTVPPHELARRDNEAMGGVDLGELAKVLEAAKKELPVLARIGLEDINPDMFLEDDEDDFVINSFWEYHWNDFRRRAKYVLDPATGKPRIDTINGEPHIVLYAANLEDLDVLGPTADGTFTVESATLWISTDNAYNDEPLVPSRLRVHGWHNPGVGDIRRVSLVRHWEDYRWVGPMYEPFRIRDVMEGMEDLIKGFGANGIADILYIIQEFEVNSGPPSQSRIAELMQMEW